MLGILGVWSWTPTLISLLRWWFLCPSYLFRDTSARALDPTTCLPGYHLSAYWEILCRMQQSRTGHRILIQRPQNFSSNLEMGSHQFGISLVNSFEAGGDYGLQ